MEKTLEQQQNSKKESEDCEEGFSKGCVKEKGSNEKKVCDERI